jgi:hypothetical protein
MKLSRFVGLCAVLALSLAFAGTADAGVRALHLSPGAPAVDVYVGLDGQPKAKVISDFRYTHVSDYLSVPSGSYSIDVTRKNGLLPLLAATGLAIDRDTDYSVIAISPPNHIEALVLKDDNTIDPNNARIRIVHACKNAPAVDIYVDEFGPNPVVTNLSYKNATGYLAIPEDTYTIRIFVAGTQTQVFVVNDLPLEKGKVYSAFAIGLLGNNNFPFGVLPTVDAGQ